MGLQHLCLRGTILRARSRFLSNGLQPLAMISLALALLIGANPLAAGQDKAASTTALSVTANSSPATSVASGTVVTLTATVTSASGTLKTGQVNFCDASAKFCTDVHVLGTAQLTGAGTATLKFRPGIGSHNYKAVFLGTNAFAGSTSGPSALTVTGTSGPIASSSSIAETGSWGNYALTGTVTEAGGTIAPTGTVSFLDASNANSVLATGTLGAAVAGVGWPSPQSLTNVLDTNFVQVADFNGDGIPDLAVNSNAVTVYLGSANGTYTEAAMPTIQGPTEGPMVIADFNGDGIPDLALGMYSSATVTILIGKGDGTFAAPAEVSLPSGSFGPSQVLTADINGDGNADLIVVDSYDSTIDVLLGNGDGTFTAAVDPSISVRPACVATGDFNGDGKIDLAIADSYTDSIVILTGNGDGTFAAAGTFHSGTRGAQIAAADFNGDGKLDLAVAGGAAATSESVTILTGNGDGTFNSPSSTPTPASTIVTFMQVVDFNQDGAPDVVLADSGGDATVFLNNGSGSLSESFPVVTGLSVPYYLMVGVGDFNGDGYPDIATGAYYSSTLGLYLTEPTETATASATVSIAAPGQHLVDASYAGDSLYLPSLSSTTPLWGIPPATATALTVTSGGSAVTSVAPGTVVTLTATVKAGTAPVTAGQVDFCDATATFCTDIHVLGTAMLSSSGTASFQFAPGAGQHSYKAVLVEGGYGMSSTSNTVALSVGPAKSPVYSDTAALSVGGQPGAYSLTATVAGYGGSAPPTGNVSFLDTSFGNTQLATAPLGASTPGLGWLISQTPATGTNPISEVTADFNGDGIPDLAVFSTNNIYGNTGAISVLFGKGDGTFTAGPTTQVATANETAYAFMIGGDFNGDGKTDLAVLSSSDTYATDTVITYLSNGDGTFNVSAASSVTNLGQAGGDVVPGYMIAGDFNGDGKLDLAIVGDYVNTGGVNILLGKGDGTFQAGATLDPAKDFGVIATGDFNGDGIPDLVATNYFEDGSSPTVFLGKGDGTFTAMTMSLTLDYFPTSIVVGDFNGDGVPDLAFSDLNGIEIALGNGDGTFKETSASPISTNGELYSLKAGDFNNDGKLDIAGADTYGDQIVILSGAGDGTFTVTDTTPAVSQSTPGPFAIVAADFNEDGVPDLAMLTKNQATESILLTEPTETASVTVSGIAPIGAGTHNVVASYAGDGNYPASTSNTAALTAGLAPLVITPAAGTYSSVQSVTITESVPGATIYYAESGTMNTPGYVAYTGPIPLVYGGYEIISAYASETGYEESNQSFVNYTLTFPQAAAPTLSPAPGYYAGAQTVTITDPDPTAQIYYTTNGTIPSLSSALYINPIPVSSSETVVARAISSGHDFSQWVNAQYLIGSSSAPMIYSIAGTGSVGYSGDGGPASLAQLDYPNSVVKDAAGNIYFSDEYNHMVRKIAAGTDVISVFAGNGYAGDSGDGGSATSAELFYPAILVLDHAGNLYIADDGTETVRAVNLASGTITTYAGNVTATVAGDGGPATSAYLGSITGLAVDASNNLYIASSSLGTVSVVNAGTGVISTIAGTSTYGFSGIGDGGPASSAVFRIAAGLAFDSSGSLYIADAGFDIVRKITASGGVVSPSSIITTVAGTAPSTYGIVNFGYSGDGGPATGALLNYPTSVALDGAGNLFIADYNNGAIREVAASTGIINTYAGNGTLCDTPSGDAGPAASASLCYASSIAVDGAGNLLLADNTQHVREIFASAPPASQPAATPAFSVPAGNYATPQSVTISDATPGASIYVTVDGTQPAAGGPSGYSLPVNVTGTVTLKAVAVAPGSLVSAAATATYNIGAFAPLISTVAGNGVPGLGQAEGPALNLSMEWPRGLAIDKAGNLYIADTEGQVIWKVTAATGQASLYAGISGLSGYAGDGGPAILAKLNFPQGLALDSSGNLYIADTDNSVIREIIAATGVIKTVAGQGNLYSATPGDGGPATSATLSFPTAVAFDGMGNLYIADADDARIRMVAAATGIITTVAGNGTLNTSGDGGPATSAGIGYANALAVDPAGDIYLGGAYEATIRKVTASTGIINTIAGVKNLAGNTGDGALSTNAEVAPYSLAVDATGDLFIANLGEVREISASTGTISSAAGIGYAGYSGDGGAATAAQVDTGGQIAFDAAGNLYLDDGAARVRKVALAAQTAATPTFTPVAGTYTAAQSVSIASATTGATIYYTTDGTTPTNLSTAYTTPLTVSASETIKAIAIEVGYYPSAVASAAYAINLAPPPTAPTLANLSPAHTSAAGAQFTLTVNGSGFTASSVVDWSSSALTTTFVSSTQLTAAVPASDIASPGTAAITVQAPGSGASNALQFEIDSAGSNTPPTLSPPSDTVTAGGTATYTVTLPSSATNVSATCLNLPAGATCSYSSSAGTLTITTASTTPTGTYTITVVFTETLPGAALILLPFLLAPMKRLRGRRNRRIIQVAIFGALAALTVVVGCGGGGSGGGGTTPPPATHQVTTSTTVTLVVQ